MTLGPWRYWLPAGFGLWLALTALCSWQLGHRFQQQVTETLNTLLRDNTQSIALYHLETHSDSTQLAERINADLANLCAETRVSLLRDCHARVQRIDTIPFSGQKGTRALIDVELPEEYGLQSLSLNVFYDYHWAAVLSVTALLAALCLTAIAGLPRPMPPKQAQWQQTLQLAGLAKPDAKSAAHRLCQLPDTSQSAIRSLLDAELLPLAELHTLCEHPSAQTFSSTQWAWLEQALRRGEDLSRAIHIADCDEGIIFAPQRREVRIHGLPLSLPATPFIYYYWYAQRRVHDEAGWYINPAANRADRDNANALIALLEQFGGHGKAINDLREKGLRAKTLDQNRSKIKEELVRALGEPLAQGYLFDMERDPRTSRNKYRLSTPVERIHFDA